MPERRLLPSQGRLKAHCPGLQPAERQRHDHAARSFEEASAEKLAFDLDRSRLPANAAHDRLESEPRAIAERFASERFDQGPVATCRARLRCSHRGTASPL